MNDDIRNALTDAMAAIGDAHGPTTTDDRRAEMLRLANERHPSRRTRIIDDGPVIPDGWVITRRHESWVDLENTATGERLAYIDPAWLRPGHPRWQHPDWQ